jgi:uncharacterized phage protein gp47/JayE
MTTYGVTETGLVIKDIYDLLDEIETDERSRIKQSLNLLVTSIWGQINGIYADKLREQWELGLAVYRASYPDSATNESLDELCSITGTTRLAAAYSTVTLDRLYVEDGITVPIGSIVSVGSGGVQFETLADVVNSSGNSAIMSVAAQSLDTGPIVALAGKLNVIVTPISGWNSLAVVQSVTGTFALVDGQTLTLKIDGGTEQTFTFLTGAFVDINAATVDEVVAVIDATLVDGFVYNVANKVWIENDTYDTGSIQVTGGTANTALGFPTTFIEGLNSLDADLGRNIELDPALRIRRELLLRGLGRASTESIRAALLDNDKTPGVTQAFVFGNVLGYTVDSIPSKAFECIVVGGTDQDIADTIFAYGPEGIETYGNTTAYAVDSMGNPHTIKFSRVVDLNMYIDLSLTKIAGVYPLDGDDQVKAALVAEGDLLDIGEDIIALKLKSIPLQIPGVEDVPVFKIDTVFPPTNTANINVFFRYLAKFDSSRIRII